MEPATVSKCSSQHVTKSIPLFASTVTPLYLLPRLTEIITPMDISPAPIFLAIYPFDLLEHSSLQCSGSNFIHSQIYFSCSVLLSFTSDFSYFASFPVMVVVRRLFVCCVFVCLWS